MNNASIINLNHGGWMLVAVIVIAVVALLVLISALRHIHYREYGRGSFKGLGGVVMALIAVAIFLVGLNLLTWQRLTHEQSVARVSFSKVAAQRFKATLTWPNGHMRQFYLRGDGWQIDARMLKWTSFATVLGLDPVYRVERISGRYRNVEQAKKEKPSVIALGRMQGLSLWQVAEDHSDWLPFVDASYGSATYLPMHDGATYDVSITTSGLLARPANAAANRAVQHWQ